MLMQNVTLMEKYFHYYENSAPRVCIFKMIHISHVVPLTIFRHFFLSISCDVCRINRGDFTNAKITIMISMIMMEMILIMLVMVMSAG